MKLFSTGLRVMVTVAALAAAGLHAAQFTVTNLNDSGPGSLRAAVNQANANINDADTIVFAVTGTIVLSTPITIIGPVSIQGPGQAALTVSGGNGTGIFFTGDFVCPSSGTDFSVSISDLTLQNGTNSAVNGSGGAILSSKSFTLTNVTVKDSRAARGGGMSFLGQHPGQTLNIVNSTFTGNRAVHVPGTTGTTSGGALLIGDLCNTGVGIRATITNSRIVLNSVQPTTLDGLGGGIAVRASGANVVILDSSIDGNEVQPPVGGVRAYYGGGIYSEAQTTRIERSSLTRNEAAYGGGALVSNVNPLTQDPGEEKIFIVINSTVAGNKAFFDGGGLVVLGNIDADIYNSTIAGNAASAAGAGGIAATGAFGSAVPKVDVVSTILAQSFLDDVGRRPTKLISDCYTGPGTTINPSSSTFQFVEPGKCTCGGPGGAACYDVFSGRHVGLKPVAPSGGGSVSEVRPLGLHSPAINRGSNPLGLATDQRGAQRVQGGAPDIGAFEYTAPADCSGFTDVPGSSPFCPNVDFARQWSITLGQGPGIYGPNGFTTRDAMAAFQNRLGTAIGPRLFNREAFHAVLQPTSGLALCEIAIPYTGNTLPQSFELTGVFQATNSSGPAEIEVALAISRDTGVTFERISEPFGVSFPVGAYTNVRAETRIDETISLPPGIILLAMQIADAGSPSAPILESTACHLQVKAGVGEFESLLPFSF